MFQRAKELVAPEYCRARADELFEQQQQEAFRNTDRLFGRLMILQWLGAIGLALYMSPLTWAGDASEIHPHVWAAIFFGGAISIFPVWLTHAWPGRAFTRHTVAVAQMLMSALLIGLSGGRIETHFHVFGSLVVLSFYHDWRVLIPATVVVVVDHFLRGVYWPYTVYGVLAASPWRFVEHAGWVAFENVFLVISCLRSVRKMRFIANRTAKLEASEEAARNANRTKDQFLAVLSHELRSPLTPVLAVTTFLSKQASKLPRELRGEIEMIQRNVELEAHLIDDLLDITKISSGKLELALEVTDVHVAIRHAFEICAQTIRAKNLSIDWKLEAARHRVIADPVRLQQVCWNLLNNAVKFTPPGGAIFVRSRNDIEGDFVLEVQDTGIGIEPEAVTRIFEAFEQGQRSVTREFGGLGLGLAISKSLVDSHGGRLEAASAGRNAGATFTLALKTVAQAESVSAKTPDSVPAPTPLRILVVDDHDDTRRVLANLLRKRGHEVLTAFNLASALEVVMHETLDVLLSDIGLPDGTGYELMERGRLRQPVVGIALSGFGTADDIRRATEAGFAHHLIKPVDFNQLESVLMRLTDKGTFTRDPASSTAAMLQQQVS
ncbi:MAG TPA: ATP-binding protein [Chthoniobacterales bacterium]|nr:ATP-binding protein [Chthoniobacterales bacterium]